MNAETNSAQPGSPDCALVNKGRQSQRVPAVPPPEMIRANDRLRNAARWWALVACAALAPAALALDLDVHERVLDNGMTVLAVRRPRVPLVSVQVWVRVGSADEQLGRTGLAHLHEHLLFKGTGTIGTSDFARERACMERQDALDEARHAELRKGPAADADLCERLGVQIAASEEEQRQWIVPSDYDQIYADAGAQETNAGTWFDSTMYLVTVPANKLELAMWLESDRLLDPVFREFHAERDVVAQERRESVDDAPGGVYREMLMQLAQPDTPYQWEILGHAEELRRLTRGDAYAFFREHYVPGNMCLVMVGDLDPEPTLDLAERYFGRLPAAPLPEPIVSVQRIGTGQRRLVVSAEARPEVEIDLPTATFGSEDDTILDVIQGLLEGESGRLTRALVEEQGLALDCWTWNQGMRAAGMFVVGGSPAEEVPHEALEEGLWSVIEGLTSDPPSPEELAGVKKRVRAGFLRGLESSDDTAEALGNYWATAGDWHAMLTWPDRVDRVTSDDVARVAGRYFRRDNAAVGWLRASEGDAE